MNINENCRCEKIEKIHTEIDNWYEYDICEKCGKIVEIRPLNQEADIY